VLYVLYVCLGVLCTLACKECFGSEDTKGVKKNEVLQKKE